MLRICFDSVIKLKLNMWQFTLLTVVFVAVTSAIESSEYKVFRIIPENNEQLKVLESIDDNEDNGVTIYIKILCWKSSRKIFF